MCLSALIMLDTKLLTLNKDNDNGHVLKRPAVSRFQQIKNTIKKLN